MIICTVYAHFIGFDRIAGILKTNYPGAIITTGTQGESNTATLEIKGGLFSASAKVLIRYRQRKNPSYQLLPEDQCALSVNLKGLYGYVSSLPVQHKEVKDQLLRKITTVNCEFSIAVEQGQPKNIGNAIKAIAQEFDAFLFVQPGTPVSRSNGQHLLDKNLALIADGQGNCEVSSVSIQVESKYMESEQQSVSDEQRERRKKSEEQCRIKNIPTYKNPDSLFVPAEAQVQLRAKDEVVDRAIALCYVEIKSEGAEPELLDDFDKKYSVKSKLSPGELDFAQNENPTEQEIAIANWRAESFHLLLWALGFVNELHYPSELCNIGEDVGHLFTRTEQEFRDAARLRTKTEILDAADLILRFNWACVNARVNQQPAPAELHPGIVYERHYALNWLIRLRDQEWDDVTTNT